MNIKIYFSILIVGFILNSCERDVEFYGKVTNPLVVVNSFVTPDSTVTAHISMSHFFLDNSSAFNNVNNAEVNLWVNGAFKEKMNLDSLGIYKGSYRPKIDDQIKLIVNVPQTKQVSAMSSILEAPTILSVDTQLFVVSKEILRYSSDSNDTMCIKYKYKVNFNLKFADNGSRKNYYRLIVRTISFEGDWNELTNKVDTIVEEKPQYSDFDFTDVVSDNTTDPLADDGTSPVAMLLSNSNNMYHVFSDDIFNGKTYSLQFSTIITQNVKDINYGFISDVKHEVLISLQSISKDYYLYLKTRAASYTNKDNYFSEPVKVYNNINNGIGILGSYTNSNIVKIKLQ